MKRSLAAIFLALFCTVAVRPAVGFSLLGQFKVTANGYSYDWQTTALGYQIGGTIGGPMYPDEGYRWNVPTIYYAFDSSFINYFGSNGIYAVEQAIAAFNSLPKMSKITNDSANLYINGQPVPYVTKRINYAAESLGLLDLKSTAMHLISEEMGLAAPERWCFAMYGRLAFPTVTNYGVIPLNFDPITIYPTNAVNGTHYNYQVIDPIANTYVDAIEFQANPLEPGITSVAGFFGVNVAAFGSFQGAYFTGLSHDDVGGLRWLYSRNSLAIENLPPGTSVGALSPYDPVIPIIGTNIGGTNVIVITNTPPPTAIRRGIDEIKFKRVNFDSLIGTVFAPFTNTWTDTIITNGQTFRFPVQRAVLFPDMVFVVDNLGTVPVPAIAARSDTIGWTNNDAVNGITTLGGPGNIIPTIAITFSENLPYYFNLNPGLLTGPSAPVVTWGSFDGSTNAPIIYPQFNQLTLRELNRLARQRPPTQPRRTKKKRRNAAKALHS